jgi:hypothetical protein
MRELIPHLDCGTSLATPLPKGDRSMAEHDRDRMAPPDRMDRMDRVDEAQDAVRERNIVRDGGIARSDAEIEDVTRDTYGTPGDRDEAPARDDSDADRPGAGEVLGIGRDVPRDANVAHGSDTDRRRRSDDLMESDASQDSSGSSDEGPAGLKVRG